MGIEPILVKHTSRLYEPVPSDPFESNTWVIHITLCLRVHMNQTH